MRNTEFTQHINQTVEALFSEFDTIDVSLLKDNEQFHSKVAETYQQLRNELPELDLSLDAYIMMILFQAMPDHKEGGSGKHEYFSRAAEALRSKVDALLPKRVSHV